MYALEMDNIQETTSEVEINAKQKMMLNKPAANDDNGINILLVDDDDVAIESVIRSMNKFGASFPVTVAHDGRDALEVLRNKPLGKVGESYLVLLDLRMPGMDGFEFLKAIRSDPALYDTEVFVLTTSDSNEDRAKAYNENIAGYLVKDQLTIFNWLYSLLPKRTSFTKFTKPAETLDIAKVH